MSIKQLTANELQADSIRMARVNRDLREADDVRFFNADGFCSRYSHACGYQDTLYHNGFKLYMYIEGCYHVRVYHDEQPRLLWNTFDCGTGSRQEAKKMFRKLRRMILDGATREEIQRQEV